MSERKRLRLAKPNVEHKPIEKCLESQRDAAECSTSSNSPETDKFPLSDLPNEVLLFIYALLSPADLAAICELGNQRLRDLTFCIKVADFSSCRKAGARRILAFFNRSRVKHITELNFSYTLYIKPHVLTQIICRCKALNVLSVVKCGIKFHHLTQIVDTCSQLEEVSWNLDEVLSNRTARAENVKTVYLFCNNKTPLSSIFFVLKHFVNVKTAWINFSPDSVTELPFSGLWLGTICVEHTALGRRFILQTNSFQQITISSDLQFLQVIINQLNAENPWCIDKTSKENADHSETFMSPPYVQFSSDEEDVSELSKFSDAFTSISVLLNPDIVDVSENLVRSINKAAGVKLKHLSLIYDAIYSEESDEPKPISFEESLAICDTFEALFLTCRYITVLNLITVHFSAGSPFKAISRLKNLKTLVISTCAFFKNNKKAHKRSVRTKNLEFKDVVSECSFVEDFTLFCCVDDYSRITETDLFPLQEWRHLKHLAIYSASFRTLNFLKKVADSCEKLQSFSLITVAPNRVCLFIPDVIYLLKNAKNLSFLRINEEKFNPMYERFWAAVEEAVNLEGICIITQSNNIISKNVIVKAVQQLKYLHLFHFSAPRATDRLFNDVKKTMQAHGVVNFSLESVCFVCSFNTASTTLYYHMQPRYCCQHIHFRKF